MTLSCLSVTFDEVEYLWTTSRRSFSRSPSPIDLFPTFEATTFKDDKFHELKFTITPRLALQWKYQVVVFDARGHQTHFTSWESDVSNETVTKMWHFDTQVPDLSIVVRRFPIQTTTNITSACDTFVANIHKTQEGLSFSMSKVNVGNLPTEEEVREFEFDLHRVDSFLDLMTVFAGTDEYKLIADRQDHLYKMFSQVLEFKRNCL